MIHRFTVFLNSDEDMRWLREVHLPNLGRQYKSAAIYGNEDYPDRIEAYVSRDPLIDDPKAAYEPDEEGVYRRVS